MVQFDPVGFNLNIYVPKVFLSCTNSLFCNVQQGNCSQSLCEWEKDSYLGLGKDMTPVSISSFFCNFQQLFAVVDSPLMSDELRCKFKLV